MILSLLLCGVASSCADSETQQPRTVEAVASVPSATVHAEALGDFTKVRETVAPGEFTVTYARPGGSASAGDRISVRVEEGGATPAGAYPVLGKMKVGDADATHFAVASTAGDSTARHGVTWIGKWGDLPAVHVTLYARERDPARLAVLAGAVVLDEPHPLTVK